MYKLRWLIFAGILLVMIGGVLQGGAAGQEPSPKREKLDALLGGLLAVQEGKGMSVPRGNDYQTETVQGQEGFLPFHTDEQGRTFVDVLIKSDGSLAGLSDLGVVVQSVVGTVVSARVPVDSLARLTSLDNVQFIEAARRLSPSSDVNLPTPGTSDVWTNVGKSEFCQGDALE